MNLAILKKLFYRLLSSIIVLLVVISFIFVLLQLSPGNPSLKYFSPKLSSDLLSKIAHSFSEEKHVLEQYYSFIYNFITGDFGVSFNYHKSVISVLGKYVFFTFLFSSSAFIILFSLSFTLAYIAATHAGNLFEKITLKVAMVLYSTPSFVSGIILLYIFAYQLELFPLSGLYSNSFDQLNVFQKAMDVLNHLILPIITLTLSLYPIYYQYLRENLKKTINSSFVVNLRSLGMKEKTILKKHIIPNALDPVIAVAGVDLGQLLGGTLIIEVIYGLPGLGRLTLNAILSLDYPLIIGCCFTAGFMIIASGFFTDLIRMSIDKRLIKGLLN